MNDEIDLAASLRCLDEDYVVVRMSDRWPYYEPGSDVDILVRDMTYAAAVMAGTLRRTHDIDIHRLEHCVHVDIVVRGSLHLRYDFVERPPYPWYISPSFTRDCIARGCIRLGARVPDIADECLLRAWEWKYHVGGPRESAKAKHRLWAAQHWSAKASGRWIKYCLDLSQRSC